MSRNLDMTALRAFVAVAETEGVTRAAGLLNLTQSAVSMQLKRLEQSLGQTLLDRSARQIGLTAQGEQLLGYGRRLLALNDEVFARLTDQAYEGEVTLGVPADIVYPHIPSVLQRFAAAFPRVKVQLISSYTSRLKNLFERGDCNMILTTETGLGAGAETLKTLPMVWVGAPGGVAYRARPLRLAFERASLFRSSAEQALERAGIPWEIGVESDSSRTVEAGVSADLAVHACLEGTNPIYMEQIDHKANLPELPLMNINLYVPKRGQIPLVDELADYVRHAYRG